MRSKTILVDLDGTIFNVDHRVHLAQKKQWGEFHSASQNDSLNDDVVVFLAMASWCGMSVVAVTGRSECYRQATWDQLRENGISSLIDCLLMRPDGDYRSDAIIKLELVDEHFGNRLAALSQVAFALDDRDSVVEGYRDAGFCCWQVRKGQY